MYIKFYMFTQNNSIQEYFINICIFLSHLTITFTSLTMDIMINF